MGITTDDIALGGAFGTEGTTDGGSLGGSFGGDESPLTQSATNEAVTSADAAKASAAAAAASAAAALVSENNADTSEANASSSATAAATSASSSASSATASANSATQSATSATSSSNSATASANSATASATSATQSSGYADDAAASAAAALVSENNASASETASAASASSAATSATTATTQATNAATSASQAATSASASASSATDSANSATASASSASAASNSAASAAVSETNAAASATAAGASESNAATSESNAATSATAAATSATSSATSASNAATSESNASTSETNAATSATNAANSAASAASDAASATAQATAAATSATNAATSESNAATSETNAATSATNAATSETNAATSESNAATSATNSANSATASAASASTAQAASDAALAALDSFDDRYLGVKSADPTVDNDGNPLVTGALYYNDVDDVMKVYEGATWVAAYASLSGALLVNNNLDDLQDVATARTNLGLGTAATTDSTAYATAAQGALADTALQSYTETDPIFTAWDKSTGITITESQITDLQPYLLSYTETDPIFSASEAASITSTDTTNWDTAFGWGDHSVKGYTVDGTAVTFSAVQLTGGTGTQGILSWNTEDETLDLVVSPDVIYQLGQETGLVVRNISGATLNNGTIVKVTGASGDKVTVGIADAATELGSAPTIGVVTEEISDNSTGRITTAGLVRGLDTSSFTEGVAIYLGSNGAYTATKPSSPNHLVHIGWVVRSHATEGIILVHVNNGWEMDELHDVLITNITDGQILQWNATSGVWENIDIPVSLPDQSGSAGLYLTTDGSNASWASVSGGIAYTRHTANYTASNQEGIIADTSGGSFTVTLPATPATGDVVVISDGSNFFNNNLIVGRNGSTIEGDAEDMTVDVAGVSVTFLYDGSTWQVYAQAGTLQSEASTYNKAAFIATEGQTLFSGLDYTVGYAEVYLNGVKLVEGDDYTALTGDSITLATGAAAGANLEVISFKSVAITDVYTQAQVDSTFLSQTDAASTYLTQTDASTTYLALTGGTVTGAVDVASLTVNGAPLEAGAKDGVFWENNTTITANYTITSGKNAGTFGPITIADGVTVTIPDGSTWTVV